MSEEQDPERPPHLDRPLAVQLQRQLDQARKAFPEPPCGHDELHRQHRLALERHRKANAAQPKP